MLRERCKSRFNLCLWVVWHSYAVHGRGLVVDAASRGAGVRPLITGCLRECGVEDQTCVTDCQVCVERHHCRKLHQDCGQCLGPIRAAVSSSGHGQPGLVADSGGLPLVRDSVSQRLKLAHHLASRVQRHLRRTREAVLAATRNVEAATYLRHDHLEKLRNVTAALKEARAEVSSQSIETQRRLRALRAASAEKRMQQKEAEARLKEDVNAKAREDILAKRKAAERAEKVAEKKEADAEWVERSVKRDRDQIAQSVGKALEDMRMSRNIERAMEQTLRKTKKQYIHVAARLGRVENKIETLELDYVQGSSKSQNSTHEPRVADLAQSAEQSGGHRCEPWVVPALRSGVVSALLISLIW